MVVTSGSVRPCCALSTVALCAILLGCSEVPVVEALQPHAVRVAQERGASQLECPAATTEVLAKQPIEEATTTGWYQPPHRAQYSIGVSGCGKSATYDVTCNSHGESCIASVPQSAAHPAQRELADEWEPKAVMLAQQQGSSELSCPTATTAVLTKETLEEPVTTGWYTPPRRARYVIGVLGCGKRTTYEVGCDQQESRCIVRAAQASEQPPQQLADEMQPNAMQAAQQRGVRTLGCPAASVEVLSSETIDEPTTTGWYVPPRRAQYTINASGCGKAATYSVICDSWHKSCVASAAQHASR